MRIRWTALATAAFLGLSGAAVAAEQGGHGDKNASPPHDQAWVQNKARTCASCHGDKGVSQTPMYPIIAGQHRSYLVHSLKAYRDGERENAIMAGQVQGMTDAQIKALAEYYSRQESPLHVPSLD